ncbi:twin-arginine translocation signal domain-containing protein [Roseivivax isoporae]|uniref:Twin-arginine translocation signal domain-containing protein n=1 Tax=Roseivivax isoporae LMG 25204 TaxID=1449351 RepID=X7F6Y1_9RHOB|nr:twin-arginine translocation signal domain-containing protein [Roseivivax isoporae]ETX27844.1 hypothetical protein RISW2_10955 [Roseivivax isoporae LMG 25204]
MEPTPTDKQPDDDEPSSLERRDFIKKSGRFAAAPAVAFLLSTTLASEAVARSGGGATRGGKKSNGRALGKVITAVKKVLGIA